MEPHPVHNFYDRFDRYACCLECLDGIRDIASILPGTFFKMRMIIGKNCPMWFIAYVRNSNALGESEITWRIWKPISTKKDCPQCKGD